MNTTNLSDTTGTHPHGQAPTPEPAGMTASSAQQTFGPAATVSPGRPADSAHAPTDTPAPAVAFSVTALVVGIIAVLLCLTFFLGQYGAVLGLVAAVFGFIAARRRKRSGYKRSMARAGLILGIIAMPLGFATAAIALAAIDTVDDSFNESMTVLDAEWHLESEYTDYANDVDATATAGEVVDGATTIRVTETGTANVLAVHRVQINDDGTFVILD